MSLRVDVQTANQSDVNNNKLLKIILNNNNNNERRKFSCEFVFSRRCACFPIIIMQYKNIAFFILYFQQQQRIVCCLFFLFIIIINNFVVGKTQSTKDRSSGVVE